MNAISENEKMETNIIIYYDINNASCTMATLKVVSLL